MDKALKYRFFNRLERTTGNCHCFGWLKFGHVDSVFCHVDY